MFEKDFSRLSEICNKLFVTYRDNAMIREKEGSDEQKKNSLS